jgi:hypothetical protein
VASVKGLLEEREVSARVRVEGLRAEAERVLAELGEAEAVLERRVIALEELAEALAAPDEVADASVSEVRESAGVASAPAGKAPVAGSVVPHRQEGMTAAALSPGYRQIVELLEFGPDVGEEGLPAKEIAARLGLELVAAKIEGVRSRAKRLEDRGWLTVSPAGRFRPRASSSPVSAAGS